MSADLVGHDGGITGGEHAFTLVLTDRLTQWTEVRAVLNKAQKWVFQALLLIHSWLPFALCALHTDSGSEFINHHLHRYCGQERIEKVLLFLAALWALCALSADVGMLQYVADRLDRLATRGHGLAQDVESLTRDVGDLLRDPDGETSVVRCPDGTIRIGRNHDEDCELIQPLNLGPCPGFRSGSFQMETLPHCAMP